MLHNNQFINDFMAHYDYPQEAVKAFTELNIRLDNEPDFGAEFDSIVNGYLFPETDGMREALDKMTELANKKGINDCTLEFVFLLNCVPTLKERYDKAGIPEKIFWDTMNDLRYKLIECMDCEEVPGTFVAGWFDGFFDMTRFAYGRFQYEVREFGEDEDFVTACGKVIKKGDTYINFHIPSSGVSLTDEVRIASYKLAYEAYKDLFPDGKMVFGCSSWLLYPAHKKFLPAKSNILRFMDDFEMVEWEEKEEFNDGWRIFGKDSDLPFDQLPRNNSLRKAYADWLSAGNKGGHGFGLFIFDGEKILK